MKRTILQRAFNVARIKFDLLYDNLYWGSFGHKSHIAKPAMKIAGKKRIYIGDRVNIYKYARIEAIHYWGGVLNGEVHIGNGTFIEQLCHITAASSIQIGEDCVFSAYVYISDSSHQYCPDEKIKKTKLDIKPVTIGNHVFVGIGSKIMPGANVGNNVVIGANSVVLGSIPDDSMAVGSPAKVIKKWNHVTHRWEKKEGNFE